MPKRGLFGASVPSTYASGIASLHVGWGGMREDSFLRQEWVKGQTTACECGLLKLKKAEGCFRCLSIDSLPANTQGAILEALEDFEARTTNQLAELIKRTRECVLRNVKPLVESGRLRGWLEQRSEVAQGPVTDDAHGRRWKGRTGQPAVRMWVRVW